MTSRRDQHAEQSGADMPDIHAWLLPMRAYLLSMRDQTLPARRVAIADSRAAYEAEPGEAAHAKQLRLLQLIGDCLQPVEDVGVLATAIMDGIPGLPFYVRATVHDLTAVHDFFDNVAGNPDEYFLRLAALRLGDVDVHRGFEFRPPLEEADEEAIAAAYASTAGLLCEHLTRLARAFRSLYGYFIAFKHGALVANPDDVTLVDDRTEVISTMGVWARRSKGVAWAGHHSSTHDEVAEHVLGIGHLALDMLDYLVATRVKIFDAMQIEKDGTVTVSPISGIPWQFWMRPSEVGQAHLDRLRERLGVHLVDVSAEDDLIPVAE